MDYRSEQVWYNIRQLQDCLKPLRNVNQGHISERYESFLSKRFAYACGMLIIAFRHDKQPVVKSWDGMVTVSGDGLTLRPTRDVPVVDGLHRFQMLLQRRPATLREDKPDAGQQ